MSLTGFPSKVTVTVMRAVSFDDAVAGDSASSPSPRLRTATIDVGLVKRIVPPVVPPMRAEWTGSNRCKRDQLTLAKVEGTDQPRLRGGYLVCGRATRLATRACGPGPRGSRRRAGGVRPRRRPRAP